MSVVIYSTGNEGWTKMAVDHAESTIGSSTSVLVIDNGSRKPFSLPSFRYARNIGGNAVFHKWMEDGWWSELPEFIAFFHCDLMVLEPGWDERVFAAFDADPLLALVGFVGSREIDSQGGRGGGTMLNYRGGTYDTYGQASTSEHHGESVSDLRAAAVLDHCSLIFRREMLEQLTPQEGFYAPEHFYDRILSCDVLDHGWHLAVLGIACDHFSGGIGPGLHEADELRRYWLDQEGLSYDENDTYTAVYLESERRFKDRYMANGFAPLKVQSDYSITR